MKNKWQLFASIFQLVIGIMAIISFIIIGFSGEPLTKWIGTLLLSVAFVVLGIIGMIDYKSNRKH